MIADSASIATTATIVGDVSIGSNSRILHGAIVDGSAGPVTIGEHVIVLENAVLKGTRKDPLVIGDHCIFGPHSYVVGATVANECFVATGASVFNGAVLGRGTEVRINAVVHLRTRLAEGSTVPIAWIAVGDPAQLFSPDQHEELWAVQRELDFGGYVFGVNGSGPAPMIEITERWARALKE